MDKERCKKVRLLATEQNLFWVCGVFLLLEGMIPGLAAVPAWRESVAAAGILLSLGVAFVAVGVWFFRQAAINVEAGQLGVMIHRGKRRLLEIPRNRLHIYTMGAESGMPPTVCLCSLSIEELAELRESQLKRGMLTRNELVFRKRVAGWQKIFAREYLRKECKRGVRLFRPQGIAWVAGSLEAVSLLKYYYPHCPWEALRNESVPKRHDEGGEEDTFPRGMQQESAALMIVLLFTLLLPFVVLLWIFDSAAGWFLAVLSAATAILLYVLMRREREVVRLTSDGIRIEGKENYLIPANSVKTIGKIATLEKIFVRYTLVVSEHTVPELRKEQEKRLQHTKSGREKMAAFSCLPNWKECCALRYLARKVALREYFAKDLLVVAYSPRREKRLREMYPEAQWIEFPQDTI